IKFFGQSIYAIQSNPILRPLCSIKFFGQSIYAIQSNPSTIVRSKLSIGQSMQSNPIQSNPSIIRRSKSSASQSMQPNKIQSFDYCSIKTFDQSIHQCNPIQFSIILRCKQVNT